MGRFNFNSGNDFVGKLPANVFEGEIGESILGLHYRVLNPNSNQGKKIKEKLNKNNKHFASTHTQTNERALLKKVIPKNFELLPNRFLSLF